MKKYLRIIKCNRDWKFFQTQSFVGCWILTRLSNRFVKSNIGIDICSAIDVGET
jgi:hypothetical protein